MILKPNSFHTSSLLIHVRIHYARLNVVDIQLRVSEGERVPQPIDREFRNAVGSERLITMFSSETISEDQDYILQQSSNVRQTN